MPRWALGLLIIAFMAGILGFGRVALDGSPVARICFFIFLAGVVFAGFWGFMKRRIP